MSFRSTLALLFLLLALCGGYWWMGHRSERAGQQALEVKRVFDFPPESVLAIEVQPLDEAPAAAERTAGGAWVMTKPYADIPPMQLLWDRLAKAVSELSNERTISERAGAEDQYGLQDPVLEVRGRAGDDTEFRVSFGYLEPTQNYRYAQLNGQGIFLTRKESFFELNRSLTDLRHRFLVEDRESPILRFEYARLWTGEGTTTLAPPPEIGEESVAVVLWRQSPESAWRMIDPFEAPADQDRVEALVNEVQFGLGRDYVDAPEALSDYGLDPPRFRITVQDARGVSQTLYYGEVSGTGEEGQPGGGIFAKRADQRAVFVADAHLLTALPQSPDAFRARQLYTRPVTALQRFEYRDRDHGFTLEKDAEGAWRLTAPEVYDVDQQMVSGYLMRLKAATAEGFTEGPMEEFGLDDPEVLLRLEVDGDGVSEIRLRHYDRDPDFYVVLQDTGAVGLMHAGFAQSLISQPGEFRSRELMRFVKAHAVQLEFQFEGKGYLFEKVHDRWLVRAPEGKRLSNQSDADRLLDALNPLRAAGAVAEVSEDRADYGLDRPVFSVYVTLQDPADPSDRTRIGPLAIGAVTPDDSQRRFAMREGHAGVFQVSQSFIELLRDVLRGVIDQ